MYKKGTVVLVPFPFTDLTGNKVRPAVIVSNSKNGHDIVVVFITSQSKLKGKNLVAIIPNNHNGIKIPSKIVCGKIATLDTKIVLGELGQLTPGEQRMVDTELRVVFGL